jgi:hypothetical protein
MSKVARKKNCGRVGYPKRGRVLDALRHIFPAEVLDEAQSIVLPAGEREWTEADWVGAVSAIAKRWQWTHGQRAWEQAVQS